MLMPKRIKGNRRKMHRGRMTGKATRGNTISFGEYAIVAQEPQWVTSRQIEAARIAMTRHIKRGGKIWIRIFPDKSYTKKPLETRMGKGKAGIEGWVAVVKPGRVMFEMAGPPVELAKEAMRLAIFKLPMRCKFVTKSEMEKLGLVSPSHAMGVSKPSVEAAVEVVTTEGIDEPTETVTEEAVVEAVADVATTGEEA